MQNTENPVNLATNLKHLRTLRKHSQQQTAVCLEVKRSSYAGYETGFVEPGASKLVAMAKHFRVSLDMLLIEDLRKWTRFDLETEQRRRTPVGTTVATPNPLPMLSKKLIHERGHKAMNNRLEENIPKRKPGEKRQSPRKVEMPATKGLVKLQLDARTVVHAKPGYAVQRWLEQYPDARVVN